MTRSLRTLLAALVATAFLAGPAALAETKPSKGPAAPPDKGVRDKGGKWFVPDMEDSDQSGMAVGKKGGPKQAPVKGGQPPR